MKTYEVVNRIVGEGGAPPSPSALARELRTRGLSLPSPRTLRRWATGRTSPFSGKRIFVPEPSEELSFFLGVWWGDGWGDDSDGGKRMLLKVRSYDFAKEFAECAAKILRKTDSYWVRRVHGDDGDWFLVKVTSQMLYSFVQKSLQEQKPLIEVFPEGFLRGFFTAEGNPYVSVENAARPYLSVGVDATNSDPELLKLAIDLLIKLGFKTGKARVTTSKGERTNFGIAKNTVYVFSLSRREDILRFAKEIGFADSAKNAKLADALSLIRDFGKQAAIEEWKRRYEKGGGSG